jgi:phosphatidylethanolamine-binding protein (PEBP) family uncharacterized protein
MKKTRRICRRKNRNTRKQRGGIGMPNAAGPNNQRGYYTAIVYDPNAPNPSYLHFLKINMPDTLDPMDGPGDVVTSYEPPNPPSGQHKYHLALYEQQGPLRIKKIKSRVGFSPELFAKQYGLHLISDKSVIISAELNAATKNAMLKKLLQKGI